MLFHPNYSFISGHFTMSPQRLWSWWIVTKSWDTNRCQKCETLRKGTQTTDVFFWRGANSANLEIKRYCAYIYMMCLYNPIVDIIYISKYMTYHQWRCDHLDLLVDFFLLLWPLATLTIPELHTSFLSDLLDRSEMHRLLRAFELSLGFKRWNWRNDEIGDR